ncbi:MAG TPA: hypothetical protein VN685_05985 [Rhizomicrobium sp.]|jgi:hypothetical protein|nr:hypothetical protein [Rhizomicrobium sp.]
MASWSHSFDMVAARRIARSRRGKAVAIAYPGGTWSDLIELEFSNFGRDSRLPSGWFIAPVMLTLLLLIPLAL